MSTCPLCKGSGALPGRSDYVVPDESVHVPSEWIVNDWRIRLERGRKGPGDVRIWVASPGGQPVLLSLVALGAITSLWYRNEDRLYPTGSGGRFVLAFLEACCQSGLSSAARVFKLNPPRIERVDTEMVS